jgi:hypothetical protein
MPKEASAMLDELDRLRSNPLLYDLLAHYAALVPVDQDAWQDRLMALEGVETHDLTRLHGELIAFDWLDQRTGQFGALREGAVTACYRVTVAGRRALQQVRPSDAVIEVAELTAEEKVPPKRRGRPRRKVGEATTAGLPDQAQGESAGDSADASSHAPFTEPDTRQPDKRAGAA